MVKNILVNGCSFSRGPNSWPYYIESNLDRLIVNLAQSGAGNDYIARSTIDETIMRSYDLVIVMWSGLERIDIRVDDIDQFSDTPYTSRYQSTQNDWPQKTVLPVNDQDYVQKDWVFGCGFLNNDPLLRKIKLFDGLYSHQDFKQHCDRSLYNILSLQNWLNAQQIPWIFSFYKNYVKDLEGSHLWKYLDKDNIFIENNLFDIAVRLDCFDADGLHPGPRAHEVWANLLWNHLVETGKLT